MSLSLISGRFWTLDAIAGLIAASLTGAPKSRNCESVCIFISRKISLNDSVVWVTSVVA